MPQQTIPAGLLGRYYAARHSFGHYRSSGVTGVYSFAKLNQHDPKGHFIELLRWSLTALIIRHQILCYGVTEKSSNSEAQFVQLESIQWEDVVEIQTSDAEDHDERLSTMIGNAHQHLWKDQHRKPAWKIIVLIHESLSTDQNVRINITFISHHAIADGTSGSAFHKTLLTSLYEASSRPKPHAEWPYVVPSIISEPAYIEDALTIPSPLEAAASTPTKSRAFTAAPPFLDPYISRVKIITIPSPQLKAILQACRKAKITLTGLIHSFIIIHLSISVPLAQSFRSITPYSLRRFTKLSNDEITNQISYICTDWEEDLLASARKLREGGEGETELISWISGRYQHQMMDELAAVPEHGSPALIEISAVPDFDNFCVESMKRGRECTYELSNIGSIKMPERPEGVDGVKLEKLVFTQCGMVVGPALGCSAVSVSEGPLVVSIHWQEGVLMETFVNDIKLYLEKKLLSFGQS